MSRRRARPAWFDADLLRRTRRRVARAVAAPDSVGRSRRLASDGEAARPRQTTVIGCRVTTQRRPSRRRRIGVHRPRRSARRLSSASRGAGTAAPPGARPAATWRRLLLARAARRRCRRACRPPLLAPEFLAALARARGPVVASAAAAPRSRCCSAAPFRMSCSSAGAWRSSARSCGRSTHERSRTTGTERAPTRRSPTPRRCMRFGVARLPDGAAPTAGVAVPARPRRSLDVREPERRRDRCAVARCTRAPRRLAASRCAPPRGDVRAG